jgi:hypothetical protein
MASAEQSSNRRVMRVKTQFTKNPMMTRFSSRNKTRPLRMARSDEVREKGNKGER